MDMEGRPSEKSQSSMANPQKLAQPKTIPFQRINDCIIKLQRQFRKSRSERGSFQDHMAELEEDDAWKGPQGKIMF